MTTEVKLPLLADGVNSGDVLNVLVKEGDFVAAEDPIIELESEKATVTVPSPVAGRVTKILVGPGEKVLVGQVLMLIDEAASSAAASATAPQAPGAVSAPGTSREDVSTPSTPPSESVGGDGPHPRQLVEVKLPALADGVEAGDILNVLVKPGDEIQVDDPIVELESEKATVSVPSPVAGRVVSVFVKTGDKVRVGENLIMVETGDGDSLLETATAETSQAAEGSEGASKQALPSETIVRGVAEPHIPIVQPLAPAVTQEQDLIPASPAVRRIAREIGLDLRRVRGSGKNGRILIEDLDPYIAEFVRKRGGQMTGGVSVAQPELPDFAQWGPVRRVKIDSLRRKIAEHLTQAWLTIPHVHQFHEADITELLALQKRHRERVKQLGASLTLTPFVMKAAVIALKEFPEFNATFDARNEEIIYKDYYHIGVAVDTPAGLIVPVIRDVDKKTIVELAVELADVAQRTRERKVALEELRGGTFTISNLGSIGGSHFTPIVNSPEVAILGVGRATKRLVLAGADGSVSERSMLPLVLGYDHRIIDGAQGARFMVRLVEVLENFEATFLGL